MTVGRDESVARAQGAPSSLVPAMRRPPVDDAHPRFVHGLRSTWRWEHGYVPKVIATDGSLALLAGSIAYGVRFGNGATAPEASIYLAATLALPLIWVAAMALARTYEPRFLAVGSEEFRRVMGACVGVVAGVGVLSLLLAFSIARIYALVAMLLAATFTLLSRYAARKALHRRRSAGEHSSAVVAVGHVAAVASLVRQMHSARYHGMRVVAACVPSGQDDLELLDLDVDVRGDFEDVVRVVNETGADSVAVLPCAELDGPRLRRLGWDLETTDADLYVAPAVMEVVGPRISIHPVCGLPLLHVERPELAGFRRVAKASMDRVVAALAVAVLALPLAAVALAIRLDSKGPAIFRQERIGRGGRPFTMLKLRTMTTDAEDRLIDLTDANEGNGVLFKVRADPRITRVGRFLRKYSIDEMPQLINVLRGEMSLVGPRPPLQREVEMYGDAMHRRFLVQPGLTGLWQINGRSDLDWDESERLDVRYVENWSFAFDVMILWKTAAAVLRGRGAY